MNDTQKNKEKELINIVDFLEVGRDKAKTRLELCEAIRIGDRAIRKLIHDARFSGCPIINVGNGYYIADPEDKEDVAEVLSYIKMMTSRRIDIKNSIITLSDWLICNS